MGQADVRGTQGRAWGTPSTARLLKPPVPDPASACPALLHPLPGQLPGGSELWVRVWWLPPRSPPDPAQSAWPRTSSPRLPSADTVPSRLWTPGTTEAFLPPGRGEGGGSDIGEGLTKGQGEMEGGGGPPCPSQSPPALWGWGGAGGETSSWTNTDESACWALGCSRCVNDAYLLRTHPHGQTGPPPPSDRVRVLPRPDKPDRAWHLPHCSVPEGGACSEPHRKLLAGRALGVPSSRPTVRGPRTHTLPALPLPRRPGVDK